MRALVALILRHFADRLDPLPEPEPCPLQHYPTVQPWVLPAPTSPDTWVTTQFGCNTETGPHMRTVNL